MVIPMINNTGKVVIQHAQLTFKLSWFLPALCRNKIKRDHDDKHCLWHCDVLGWISTACRFWKLPRSIFKAALHRVHIHKMVHTSNVLNFSSLSFRHHPKMRDKPTSKFLQNDTHIVPLSIGFCTLFFCPQDDHPGLWPQDYVAE